VPSAQSTLATIPEVPGAISQGRSREAARENVIDALRTVLTSELH
jgi:predicted RNase H-like HicB family nuclease